MEDDSPAPDTLIDPTDLDALADGDPEIRALLDFTPVPRKTRRHDGWPPELQRAFIAALARIGSYRLAAQSLDRSGGGAESLRKSLGSDEFAEAWKKAMALYHKRNLPPVRMVMPPPQRALSRADLPAGAAPAGPAAVPPIPDPEDPEVTEARKLEIFESILRKYERKLAQERTARLEGRIVEADFCSRQLTYIEVLLDLNGQGFTPAELLQTMRDLTPPNMMTVQAAATPMSVYLDDVRRAYWREMGEPDRPPLAPLGEHDGRIATGPSDAYNSERDGDFKQWLARQDEKHRLAAEAQKAWEEKAKAEAEEWRKQVEGDAGETEPQP